MNRLYLPCPGFVLIFFEAVDELLEGGSTDVSGEDGANVGPFGKADTNLAMVAAHIDDPVARMDTID